jgi:hypothetical protein
MAIEKPPHPSLERPGERVNEANHGVFGIIQPYPKLGIESFSAALSASPPVKSLTVD